MTIRIAKHIAFWICYILLYVVLKMMFAAPSDLEYPVVTRFFRFFASELAVLPWKAIPFYFLFYFLLPKYFKKGKYVAIVFYFALVVIICLFGYRSMISPISNFLYNETPDFNVYSFKRLVFSLTDILPAVGIASTIKLLSGRASAQKRALAIESEKRQAELRFLRSQLNPHFLFNTLNNLYGLARKNAPDTAPSILKLAEMMRFILKKSNQDRLSIEDEVRIIRDYVELEKLRYGNRLQIKIDEDIDDQSQQISPLLLLPFVENAFKHGVSESRGMVNIDISIKLQNGILDFKINNAIEPADVSLDHGIGLSNIKRQLELLYDQYELTAEPDEGQFVAHLKLNLNE